MKRWHGWLVGGLAAAVAMVTGAFLHDMRQARQRVSHGSQQIDSPWGAMEFAQGGQGTPVLVVHGSGGGFDQGTLIAQALLGDGMHWIAPSRMGYLRSALPEGATFETQAHAFAHLLDQLGLQRVAVVAMSQGGPSALLFARLYPDRVSSLTLVSCGVAASTDPAQVQANANGDALASAFRYDFVYWAISHLMRPYLLRVMGVDEAVVAQLTPAQQTLADRVIDEMNPVSLRAQGVQLDNRAAMPNERIEGIRAPTLILHAADDGLQLFHNAEYAAAHISGARLHRFERGGHLLIVVQQSALGEEVRQFIRQSGG